MAEAVWQQYGPREILFVDEASTPDDSEMDVPVKNV